MEIDLLVINAGNSRLAMGTFSAGELTNVARVSIEHRSDWAAAIGAAWHPIADKAGAAVAGASVNPAAIEMVEHAVKAATNQPVQWVGRQLDLPLKNLTEKPEQTGADRLLNVAAAFEQMQKACVVVDAGTAITINLCDDKGNFLGGAIAPGAGTMLKSLAEHTAKLPLVSLAVPEHAVGKTTEDAIRNGVYHGIRGMVKEIVENYATELGNWPEIIATGGDAQLLFDGWDLIHAISPDLTLYGIALAYAEHHIRHGS